MKHFGNDVDETLAVEEHLKMRQVVDGGSHPGLGDGRSPDVQTDDVSAFAIILLPPIDPSAKEPWNTKIKNKTKKG